MNKLSPEERVTLRDSVHKLLTDECSENAVRTTMETSSGFDPVLWRKLAEMGIVGLIIDQPQGGAGVGPVELEMVMEEVGAALLCSPLLASGVLAAELLKALQVEDVANRLLPTIASGECIATAVLTGQSGCWTQSGVTVTAEGDASSNEWYLTGSASYVLHGQNANLLLVAANTPDGAGMFVVDAGADGIDVASLPTFDHTLRLASISFDNVAAERINTQRPVWDAVRQALDVTLVALAGEQAGAAEHCLTATVDYAKTRIQFGRAIGSFQAIKHMAADLLLETESALSAARNAAVCLADDASNATEAISLAAFACADTFVTTAATNVQMYGGIAFTWEHPAHLYLRRARANAQLFGSSDFYRERFMQQLGA
ncbi:MAG: acyl-CoA/acyl-ACP dehydrogenase [Pseudomonadales bacterium]|nr:acyl-CoA/acyl-ACP dehydrogenase [Pseudomonadales bacterium]